MARSLLLIALLFSVLLWPHESLAQARCPIAGYSQCSSFQTVTLAVDWDAANTYSGSYAVGGYKIKWACSGQAYYDAKISCPPGNNNACTYDRSGSVPLTGTFNPVLGVTEGVYTVTDVSGQTVGKIGDVVCDSWWWTGFYGPNQDRITVVDCIDDSHCKSYQRCEKPTGDPKDNYCKARSTTSGAGTFSDFGGASYAVWRDNNGDLLLPDISGIMQELQKGSLQKFKGYIDDFTAHDWNIETPDPATRIDASATQISGTFAAKLTRWISQPSTPPQPAVNSKTTTIVNEKEDVATKYLRMHELASALAVNSRSMIDARIHKAIRDLPDHQDGGANTCGGDQHTCDSNRNFCGDGRQNSPCGGNRISGDPDQVARTVLAQVQNELNSQFNSEGISVALSIETTPRRIPSQNTRLFTQEEVAAHPDRSAFHFFDESGRGTYGLWTYHPRMCTASCGGDCSYTYDCSYYDCTGGTTCDWSQPKTSTYPGCFSCQGVHYDMAYEYTYTIKVEFTDTTSQIYTPEGLKNPKLVFLIDGFRARDNDCGTVRQGVLVNYPHPCGSSAVDPFKTELLPESIINYPGSDPSIWTTRVTPQTEGSIPAELQPGQSSQQRPTGPPATTDFSISSGQTTTFGGYTFVLENIRTDFGIKRVVFTVNGRRYTMQQNEEQLLADYNIRVKVNSITGNSASFTVTYRT